MPNFCLYRKEASENKNKLVEIYTRLIEQIKDRQKANTKLHNEINSQSDNLHFTAYLKEKASLPTLTLELELLKTEATALKADISDIELDKRFSSEQAALAARHEAQLAEIRAEIAAKQADCDAVLENYRRQCDATRRSFGDIERLQTTLDRQLALAEHAQQLRGDEETANGLRNELDLLTRQFDEYKRMIAGKMEQLSDRLANGAKRKRQGENTFCDNGRNCAERAETASCSKRSVFRGTKRFGKRAASTAGAASKASSSAEDEETKKVVKKRKLFEPNDCDLFL